MMSNDEVPMDVDIEAINEDYDGNQKEALRTLMKIAWDDSSNRLKDYCCICNYINKMNKRGIIIGEEYFQKAQWHLQQGLLLKELSECVYLHLEGIQEMSLSEIDEAWKLVA